MKTEPLSRGASVSVYSEGLFCHLQFYVSALTDSEYTFNFRRFLVRVSYLEIYNEEVRDLLGKDQLQRLEVKRYLNSTLKHRVQ